MTSTRQALLTHLTTVPHAVVLPKRATLVQLQGWHTEAHRNHLPHTHSGDGLSTGEYVHPVVISLAPPRGGASRQDQTWTLVVSTDSMARHFRLPSTFSADPEGAQHAANIVLGYKAPWRPQGWGYTV